MSVHVNVSIYIAHQQTDFPSPRLYALGVLERSYHANKNVFSRRLKAASVEFGLRTGSERLFQADGPAMAKARPAARVESVTWYVQEIALSGTEMSLDGHCHAMTIRQRITNIRNSLLSYLILKQKTPLSTTVRAASQQRAVCVH